MQLKKIKISFVFLFCFLGLRAQDTLSFYQLLNSIQRNYPLYLKSDNLKAVGKSNLKSAQGAYDPFLALGYDNKFYNSKNYYSQLDAKLKVPIFTSQYITGGYQYAQGNYINPENITSSAGMPFLGIEASVLQGLSIDKRRADVLKAKNYLSYYEAEAGQLQNELLYTAANNYTDWAYANKVLQLYNYFTKIAQQRLQAIKGIASIGEVAAIDSVEAAIVFQSRLLDMQSSIVQKNKSAAQVQNIYWPALSNAGNKDKNLMIKDSLGDLFDRSLKKITGIWGDSMQANPLIKKYNALQGVLEVESRYKAELIKPKLDLSYNFLSPSTAPLTTNLSTNNYKWGLNFSFPIFLRTARSDYKIAKLNAKNNNLEKEAKYNELKVKADFIKQNIQLLLDQFNMAKRNVSYSKQLLEAERLKFNSGESSLFLLNTREARWLESELKLAEYQLKFIKVSLEAIYLAGDLNFEL